MIKKINKLGSKQRNDKKRKEKTRKKNSQNTITKNEVNKTKKHYQSEIPGVAEPDSPAESGTNWSPTLENPSVEQTTD